uniref:Chromosome transmission fidelity protein 8 n=1 Tax=Timema monikensis TaxID=170555 RepID=A0A7R9E706_9NEOP|nr:unnamed protein product [Timema monikensis]
MLESKTTSLVLAMSRGTGFYTHCLQIFWEVVGLEQSPLRLVLTTELFLGLEVVVMVRKISVLDEESRETLDLDSMEETSDEYEDKATETLTLESKRYPLPDGSGINHWGLVELQGDLQSRSKNCLYDQFIGDLHYSKEGVPMLIIGHHILHGKEVTLEKPFVVMQRVQHSEDTFSQPGQSEYIVKAIVKKKLLFKTRPKPIIANMPRHL